MAPMGYCQYQGVGRRVYIGIMYRGYMEMREGL